MLFLVFYMFAILAMILFKENDPWHFATLHLAILSLFRASTFEDWTDIMYINMYGCVNYGYDYDPAAPFNVMGCDPEKSRGVGVVAAAYFFVFIILGSLVLLTLFIGVVTTPMKSVSMTSAAMISKTKKKTTLASPDACECTHSSGVSP